MSSLAHVEVAAEGGAPRATSEPHVRTAIAFLVTHFPRVDDTSILREITELERQGQPIVLVPLIRDRARVIHEEAKPWLRRALRSPLLSPSIVLSNLREIARDPRRYFSILFHVATQTLGRPAVCAKTVALFPKSVHLAQELERMGIRHVHAQFASHASTVACIVSAFSSSITYSITVHGPDVFVHRLLLREKVEGAKFIRTVSLFNKAYLAGLYPHVEDRIAVVHTGVNPQLYASAEEPERSEGEPLRILSVASLTTTKGFTFLLDAIARLAKRGVRIDCRIVGGGSRRARIEQYAEHLGIAESVHLLGLLPQHEVARLMRECDVFVLPSVIAWSGQMDGLPIALMEAMAAGRPVIASRISGIPELVENRVTGFLVDATHPERISEALRRLAADPSLRRSMGRAGRERVERDFDVARISASLIELFDRHEHERPSAREHVTSISWEDLGIVAVGIRRIHERRDSVIAEVAITDGITKREVVVKRQKNRRGQSRPAAARARDEFVVLNRLRRPMLVQSSEATGVVAYTVPRVLLFDEEHGAIVLEHARGTALDVLIRQGRLRRRAGPRLVTPMRRAGAWLRAMQQETGSSADGREILSTLVEQALQELEIACATDRVLRGYREVVVEKIRSLERRTAALKLKVAGHHGDYWPGNVFVGGRRVDVIDFEGFREGLPLEDVAYFLVHARLFFSYPFISRIYPRLAAAFVRGYGGVAPEERELLELLVAAKALQVLAKGAGGESLRALWHRRVLRQMVLRSAT